MERWVLLQLTRVCCSEALRLPLQAQLDVETPNQSVLLFHSLA
eukprot:SAG22_NODE_66_length_22936_cov_626.714279_9_plen_43_part_00